MTRLSASKPSHELSRQVTYQDTAAALMESLPRAASTPFVLGLAEIACHEAYAHRLKAGEITVGVKVSLEHTAPSRVGATLRAVPVMSRRVGRRLYFTVEVFDGPQRVARLKHQRAVVERSRMQEALGER
jgi:fluoroacetyl-CoA thioesterase